MFFATNRGIALFFSVVFVSVGLAVALGFAGLVFGEFQIAKDARDLQRAFYIADSGIECMLQAWSDVKWETPSTPVAISCFGQTITMPAAAAGPVTVRNVDVNFPDDTCVNLEVTRNVTAPAIVYFFAARGQTSCAAGGRSVQVGRLWKQE